MGVLQPAALCFAEVGRCWLPVVLALAACLKGHICIRKRHTSSHLLVCSQGREALPVGRLADLVKQLQQVRQCCLMSVFELVQCGACIPVMLRVAERMRYHLELKTYPAGHVHACCVPQGSLCWPSWQPAVQVMLLAVIDHTDLAMKPGDLPCDQACCCLRPHGPLYKVCLALLSGQQGALTALWLRAINACSIQGAACRP